VRGSDPGPRSPASVSVAALLREGRETLRASAAIDHWHSAIAREDAEDLLALALGIAVEDLDRGAPVTAAARRRYLDYIARRAGGEPVALIRGWVSFEGLRLRVRQGVFVPRNSSETLARKALAVLRRRSPAVAVDVACGAGPVACALAARQPAALIWGLDIDAAAVSLARSNARHLHLANARFRVSDLLSALPARLRGGVAVITMHPPYVGRGDLRALPREVRGFEPRHTLSDGSADGLGLVRALLAESPEWLLPGGSVLVEVAPYLSRSVQALMRRQGLEVTVTPDPAGLTRVIRGRWGR
jgi:release factor glutamine methyltransferase